MAIFGVADATVLAMILLAKSERPLYAAAVGVLWVSLFAGTLLGVIP